MPYNVYVIFREFSSAQWTVWKGTNFCHYALPLFIRCFVFFALLYFITTKIFRHLFCFLVFFYLFWSGKSITFGFRFSYFAWVFSRSIGFARTSHIFSFVFCCFVYFVHLYVPVIMSRRETLGIRN